MWAMAWSGSALSSRSNRANSLGRRMMIWRSSTDTLLEWAEDAARLVERP